MWWTSDTNAAFCVNEVESVAHYQIIISLKPANQAYVNILLICYLTYLDVGVTYGVFRSSVTYKFQFHYICPVIIQIR